MATRSWNRVELIGNLTRDPEMRYTPSGTAVATFSIATNRTFVSDGEKKEEVDFHRIVAWGKLAELCSQLLKKGNRVFVSGRLQNRSWEGQDGVSKQSTEIVIEDMLLLTNKSDSGVGDGAYTEEEMPSRSEENFPEEGAKSSKAAAKSDDKKEEDKPKQEEVGDIDDLPF